MSDTSILAGAWFRFPVPVEAGLVECSFCGARASWLLDRPYDLDKMSPAKGACNSHGISVPLWSERHHYAPVKNFIPPSHLRETTDG